MTAHPTTKTALVTGASSGIGHATAKALAATGYRVFGTSRHQRSDQNGVEMLRLDIRSEESVADCVAEIQERSGHPDVLVNNAGVMHEGFAEETTVDEATEVFATNLLGAVRVTNALLPAMRARRKGRVVNVGSLAGWIGEPGEAFYAGSKAALARYTEALRHEVWHLGIAVSLVEPGAFTTNVARAGTTSSPRIPDYDGPRESARDTLHTSLRRGEDPRLVADVVAKVVRTPRPRARYGVGREAGWLPLLTTALPGRLTEHLLRRAYRLPGRPRTPRGTGRRRTGCRSPSRPGL